MGLPGAGKTTLAECLARELKCPHFNADDIRKHINKDLEFSIEDRIEQAKRMGYLCEITSKYFYAIADFVCPTSECREAFGADFLIWVDRIKVGRFQDTNKMFVPPITYDYRVTLQCKTAQHEAELIKKIIVKRFNTFSNMKIEEIMEID